MHVVLESVCVVLEIMHVVLEVMCVVLEIVSVVHAYTYIFVWTMRKQKKKYKKVQEDATMQKRGSRNKSPSPQKK